MTENQWIDLIAKDAQKAANEYGYIPSVLIAQTCRETGYGETLLSKEGIYNTVGMKKELLNDTWESKYWDGVTLDKSTPEWYNGIKIHKIDSFRVYDSYYDGLADFCQFLRDAKYSKSGAYKYRDLLGGTDPESMIKAVAGRGYCTDPEYPEAIMAIIRKHNLTQYDGVKKGGAVEKPEIIDRIAENEHMVPYHNANDHEYLAIHYLGVNGENPDLYQVGNTKGYGGHFYVAKDGTCYQAAKVTDEIWHVGKGSYDYIHPHARNSNTIGIECATFTESGRNDDDETWYFTQATQEACARLAAWILTHYRIPIENLLRHGDITTKNCPSPYKRDEGRGSNWTWEQFKTRVRAYMGATEGFEIIVGGNHMIEIPQTLKKGDTGKPVFVLEHFLKARGYYKGNLDHSFGDLCDAAVKQFQKDRYNQSGVCLGNSDGTPDGIVGTKTWEDLFGGFDA